MGYESISVLLKRRFYWPGMDADIKEYCRACEKCQLNRPGKKASEIYVTPVPSVAIPFERWGIDFIQNLQPSKSGNRHILTAIDYASRWLVACAVKEMTEIAVVEFLFKKILVEYGTPYELISDRGKSFLSEGVRAFISKYQIYHLKTTPYHPQTNGMVERVHSILNHSIRTLSENDIERWDEVLDQAVFGIRIRKHAVTGLSPFQLVYGLEVRLPVDLEFPIQLKVPMDEIERAEALANYNAYRLSQLGQSRAAAYFKSIAQAKKMEKLGQQKHLYDIGSYVKVKKMNRTKFDPLWSGPYIVVELGFERTYWLMKANGQRLDSLTNEAQMAPWISQKELDALNEERLLNGSGNTQAVEDIPQEGDSVDT
jgi:hypothetical protein